MANTTTEYSDSSTYSSPDYKSDPNLAGYCSYCLQSGYNGNLSDTTTTMYSTTAAEFDDSVYDEIAVENDTIEDNALCEATRKIDNILTDRIILIPAFGIIICLALFLQRKFLFKNIFNGRPGFVYPLNLLEGHKHRYVYVAAFVVVSLHMFNMVITTNTAYLPYYYEELKMNMKPFFILAACLMKALEFYPVFACLTADNLFGYGIGTLYVWTLMVTFSLDDRFCFSGVKEVRALEAFKLVPPAVCLICISLYLPFRFVKHLLRITKKEKVEATVKTWQQCHNILYVKELMSRHKNIYVPPTKFIDKVKYKVYWPLPTFKYSICILTAVFTGLCFTYMAALGELAVMYELIENYKKLLRVAVKSKKIVDTWLGPAVFVAAIFDMDVEAMYRSFIAELIFWVNWIFQPLVYLSIILAFISVAVSMLLTMKNYRHNLFLIYKNEHEDLQRAESFKPRGILINGVKFIGYQISYAAWGFVIQSVLIFLITFFIATILMFMFHYHFYKEMINWFINKFWCVITTILVLLVVQNLMAHFVFLLKGDNGQKVLALNNRRIFFNFHYFATFTNIAVGLVSCILRIFRAVLFGLWTVPRLDMSTLSRDLERFDAGYMSYLGLLYLEHTQRNPILLVFVNIMMETIKNENRNTITVFYEKKCITKQSTVQFKRVRNRFKLWLTLDRNPGLRLYRKNAPSLVDICAMDAMKSKRNSKLFVPYVLTTGK